MGSSWNFQRVTQFSVSFGLCTLLAACGGSSTPENPVAAVADAAPAAVSAAPVVEPVAPASVAPSPPPVNTSTVNTGTTAYGVLGTPTARVVFLPTDQGVSAVVLENSTPATIKVANARLLATTNVVQTIAFTFKVDACAVDSNDLKGICIGYNSSRIGVMDLSKYATTLATADITVQEFDSGAGNTKNSYSGGSCIVCGVAADVGKKRFVVGGTGGFRVFNYGSTVADATYAIPVGENFAFYPQPTQSSFIIAPEYETNNGSRKLRVVNLESKKVYVWDKNTDSIADLGPEATSFRAGDVDAAAVDINTGMIALTSEYKAEFLLIDFGQAKFDDTTGTFSSPFQLAIPAASNLPRLTDVTISTTGSMLLSHGEFSDNIGLTKLADKTGSGNVFPASTNAVHTFLLNDPAFDRSACGTGSFIGKGDPHGLGLYAGLDNGQRGLVINADNTCAAIIDLAGLLALPVAAGRPNQIDMTLPAVKALVDFVKLN